MSFVEYLYLDVEKIVHVTDLALLCLLEDGRQLWIPKSQVENGDEYKVGEEDVELGITKFIAKANDLCDLD